MIGHIDNDLKVLTNDIVILAERSQETHYHFADIRRLIPLDAEPPAANEFDAGGDGVAEVITDPGKEVVIQVYQLIIDLQGGLIGIEVNCYKLRNDFCKCVI